MKNSLLKHPSIKARLALGFTLVCGIFVLTIAAASVAIASLSRDVQTLQTQNLPNVLLADDMNLSRSDIQQFLTDVAATHEPAGYKDAEEAAQRFQRGIDKFRQLYQQEKNAAGLQELAQLEADFNKLYAMGKAMAAVYVAQGMEAGNALMKGSGTSPGFDKASEVLLTHMDAFRQREVEEANHLAANAEKTAVTMSTSLVTAGLLACVLAALIAAWVVRSILQLLGGEPGQAAQLAQRVGAGDLSVPIELRPGDTASLMAELKTMQQRLSTVVARVRQSSDEVATSSVEITRGNSDLSARTEQQASALEQTAASMEELGATVRQNAESARQGNQLAQLHAADVLLCDVPPDALETFRRQQKHQRMAWKRRLWSPLALRFPLLDPDRFLARTLPWVQPLFGWFGAVLWLMVVGAGVVLTASHWTDHGHPQSTPERGHSAIGTAGRVWPRRDD